ncbi:MAG: Gfo/Idh/MocA family protein [Verrucomicrobiales bacterium]
MKTSGSSVTRRHFLKRSAAVLLAPAVIPSRVLGLDGATAPSNKISMAIFGWGMQGPHNTGQFLGMPEVQVVASCNVDQKHLEVSLNRINDHYKNKDCKSYKDFREVMQRKDIDAVMLALPDTWHALVAVEAAKNGKDIYGEKPLARTIREQQAIVKAVKDNKRIFQVGSQQRSSDEFHKACELVSNGTIGKVTAVEVGLPGGHTDFAGTRSKDKVTDPPPHLDYDMWLGPSQMEPYIEARVHMNWRWNYNVGGGQLLDWIGHHCDIAHWGMGWDATGPSEVKGIQADFPPREAMWNTATRYRSELTYPGDVRMTIAGGHADIRDGTKFIGSDGWIWVNRGAFESSNPDFRKFSRLPEAERKVSLFKSPGHHRNFIDCVKSRQPTVCTAEIGHRSATAGHLSLIACLTGQPVKWDAAKEEVIGNSEGSKLLGREFRAPWKLA